MKSPKVTDQSTPESITLVELFLTIDKAKHITERIIGIQGKFLSEYQMKNNDK
ncbi:MAG: hypothetical protein ACXACK_08040 [Candidatus Hodarchaeales archaeon]|jgi:hypothetical protein